MPKLPTYEQLRCYWVVAQGEADLPCAMFLLECDARDWVAQQESKDVYMIVAPNAPRSKATSSNINA
jgi:hypothetical protein